VEDERLPLHPKLADEPNDFNSSHINEVTWLEIMVTRQFCVPSIDTSTSEISESIITPWAPNSECKK